MIMESLSNATHLKLFWVQPRAMERSFVLRGDEREFASLEFKSSFGSLALAEAADGRWTFKRVGFFNPRVTIRRAGEELDLGVYRPRWTGSEGTLEMGGRTYVWKTANFWATQFVLLDSSGGELLRYKEGAQKSKLSDIFKNQAQVEIAPHAWRLPELSLLVMLGWYLIILHQEDAAAAATAASAAAT
jgi:hypothetical protein